MVGVLGVLMLVGACASSEGESGGRNGDKGGTMSFESAKSSVDDLTGKILPQLASALDGEFPLVRGQFLECGVGPQYQRYSVRGELHSTVVDDAQAAEDIRVVLAGAGLDVMVDDDQTVAGTSDDGTDVIVDPGFTSGATIIRSLTINTECQTYSSSDSEKISDFPVTTY
jgi:hypothetical protein